MLQPFQLSAVKYFVPPLLARLERLLHSTKRVLSQVATKTKDTWMIVQERRPLSGWPRSHGSLSRRSKFNLRFSRLLPRFHSPRPCTEVEESCSLKPVICHSKINHSQVVHRPQSGRRSTLLFFFSFFFSLSFYPLAAPRRRNSDDLGSRT